MPIHPSSQTVEPQKGFAARDCFQRYNHLGNHYPCYCTADTSRVLYAHVGQLLGDIRGRNWKIDPAGVIEMLGSSFMYGNRTLVENIEVVPWMARPDATMQWEYCDIPAHGSARMAPAEAAKQLKNLLIGETLRYLEGKKRVAVLLSGGMDSRILAGIVKSIQLNNDFSGDIIAFTWGLKNSRDVLYASRIAREYAWDWVHFELHPELLEKNIYIAGETGAAFAPFHLHAMPAIRPQDSLDAVIAGSYGDSVGRAEFSGKHILSIKTVLPKALNRLGLLRSDVVARFQRHVWHDAYDYKKHIIREAPCQYYEIEQQMHYMRRKLQACMSYIAEKIPCYQIFTHPETFGFMWGLDPHVRNDQIYREILGLLPGAIAQIPWARTGRPYLQNNEKADTHDPLHNAYGTWLRRDLHSTIRSLVDSETIRGLGLFNNAALNRLLKIWPKATTRSANTIDEAVAWLASLSVFVKKYDLRGRAPAGTSGPKDAFLGWRGSLYAYAYLKAREKYRD